MTRKITASRELLQACAACKCLGCSFVLWAHSTEVVVSQGVVAVMPRDEVAIIHMGSVLAWPHRRIAHAVGLLHCMLLMMKHRRTLRMTHGISYSALHLN